MADPVNYSIGLDIGTNSVGWAVVDENFNLQRRKGKNLWGVRLFESAETAESRRLARGQRRRYVRRKERIILLRELLENMVLEKDSTFFIRMEESFRHLEERQSGVKYNLFIDKEFTDKEYFERYPTIYHLRKMLIDSSEKQDPRLIYLALHHILKYRGNFLYEGQSFSMNNSKNAKEIIRDTLQQLDELTGFRNNLAQDNKVDGLYELISQLDGDKRKKQKEILNFLLENTGDKRVIEESIKILLGYKGSLAKLFSDESLLDDSGKEIQIEFSSSQYEDEEDAIGLLLEEKFFLIESLKSIYSLMVLQGILSGSENISEAMIDKYDKHKKDLQFLKKIFKKHFPDQYGDFFRSDDSKAKNYTNYVKGITKCSVEDLHKNISRILSSKEEALKDKNVIYCLEEIDKNDFLAKQNHRDNGAIPYQLNKAELERIIENQKRYYPQLLENKEKIISLLEFRIPYYVGPLNPKSEFAWIKRFSDEKIYPWNFDRIVDKDLTAEGFITRMTNYCSYLPEEKVIPKNSLLYSEYMVISEIKQIKINNRFLSTSDRNRIFEGLFKKQKNITERRLKDWLDEIDYPKNKTSYDGYDITGYQKEKQFATSLRSYHDFTKIFGEINSSNKEMIELIIYWITVYEDKEIVKRRLKKELNLPSEKIKEICRLRYTGWSRLSEKLLTGLKTDYFNGRQMTIMQLLQETDENFMQIISNKDYTFSEQIKEHSVNLIGEKIVYENIKDLQGSPAIKRGIWQTSRIVEELVKVMGQDPDKIFLEFAREDQPSRRSRSRFQQLRKLYETLSKELGDYNKELLSELRDNEGNINKEKFYLYFLQNGKSLYSGKKLDLNNLENYEVDHIVPRSIIKDDSFDNKALVLRSENQSKEDNYPLDMDIQKKNFGFWKYLLDNNLITPKKFNALTRIDRGTNEYEHGFINRQLVETRQIVKKVANLFEGRFLNTDVVAIKADLVSNFRNQYNIYKVREINDLHHAKDAYLTAVMGTYLLKRFPGLDKEFIYGEFRKSKEKARKKTSKQKNGFVIATMDQDYHDVETGEIVWKKDEQISKIKRTSAYNDCFVTKKLEEGTGQFFELTLRNKKDANATKQELVPRKKGWEPEKYGAYGSLREAYFVLIEHEYRGKRKKEIIGIPINKSLEIKNKANTLEKYLTEERDYINVKIIKKRILKNQLLIEDNKPIYLASSQEIHNAKQLKMPIRLEEYIYQIVRGSEKTNKEKNKEVYDELLEKLRNEYELFPEVLRTMQDFRDTFLILSVEDQSKVLLELIKVTRANASNANLGAYELNGKKLGNRIGRKSRYSIKFNDTYFITHSITGIFEKREKL